MVQSTITGINVRGRVVNVPACRVNGLLVAREGKWLKIAKLHDEEWLPDLGVEDHKTVVDALRQCSISADLFSFAQKLPETAPKYRYHLTWDNLSVACTSDFSAWWNSLPQESRKNVRRSEKRGVLVKPAEFDDELVKGIQNIYNETPVRQGRRFWHYGKDIETIKRENSSYLERSQFVAAYYEGKIIGFLKMVYVGNTARIMQILAMKTHADKRPMNTLIAKAIKLCSERSISHFIYGQHVYGNRRDSSVTEFKRRNGFVEFLLPRYYVPLTLKGRLAIGLRMYGGLKNILPESVLSLLLNARATFYERSARGSIADCIPEAKGREKDVAV